MKRLTEHDEAEINSILSREDEILPSSGFTISVMDAVRREATAPSPIPFPWKRALPGLVVGCFALVLVLVAGVRVIAQLDKATGPQVSMSSPSVAPLLLHGGGIESAATWTVLALVLALVSVKLSVRLTSGRV
jgi:hypothetical protein